MFWDTLEAPERILVCGNGDRLFARRPALLDWRLAIALLERGKRNRQHELLFAMIVKLNYDVFLCARNNRS